MGDRCDVRSRTGPHVQRDRPRHVAAGSGAISRLDRHIVKRARAVLIATSAVMLFASVASALPLVDSAAVAGEPATRGTMVQETPTLPPPVPRVLWVGDSSLEGIKFYSHAFDAIGGMTYVFDAESCRRLVRPSCHSQAGNTPNTALEAIRGAPGAFDAVVIGTGYNEGSFEFARDFDIIVGA